jgi:hypothetical protein
MPLLGGATDLNETGGSNVPRFAALSRSDAAPFPRSGRKETLAVAGIQTRTIREPSIDVCLWAVGTFETCRWTLNCLLIGVDRKWSAHGQSDALDPWERTCQIGAPTGMRSLETERTGKLNTTVI